MQKWLILGVVVVVCILTTFIVFNLEIETEYVPEVEVSSEELRKSLVSVYLKNKTSNELVKENILVDSKLLLRNVSVEIMGDAVVNAESLDIENIKKALNETLKVLTEVDSVKLIVDGKEL